MGDLNQRRGLRPRIAAENRVTKLITWQCCLVVRHQAASLSNEREPKEGKYPKKDSKYPEVGLKNGAVDEDWMEEVKL